MTVIAGETLETGHESAQQIWGASYKGRGHMRQLLLVKPWKQAMKVPNRFEGLLIKVGAKCRLI